MEVNVANSQKPPWTKHVCHPAFFSTGSGSCRSKKRGFKLKRKISQSLQNVCKVARVRNIHGLASNLQGHFVLPSSTCHITTVFSFSLSFPEYYHVQKWTMDMPQSTFSTTRLEVLLKSGPNSALNEFGETGVSYKYDKYET